MLQRSPEADKGNTNIYKGYEEALGLGIVSVTSWKWAKVDIDNASIQPR